MEAGDEREALLRAVNQLGSELGYVDTQDPPGATSKLGGDGGMAGILDPKDEALVEGLRRGLAKISATIGTGADSHHSEIGVTAALDGMEMVVRGKLVMGNLVELPTLLPSFVFIVALTLVAEDRALELSRRAAELLDVS